MSKKRKARRAHARKRNSYATNPSRPAKRRRRRHHAVSFKTNPRRRRSYRRNPGDSPKDIFIMIGAGLAAAIAAPKLVSKLPGSLMVKNLGMILAGVAVALLGRKKNVLVGVGAGLVVAGATRAITNAIPMLAGDDEFNGDEQKAILENLSSNELNGPMNGPMDGDDFLNGPWTATIT